MRVSLLEYMLLTPEAAARVTHIDLNDEGAPVLRQRDEAKEWPEEVREETP